MHFRVFMPDGGEKGVIIVTRSDGVVVEFRGKKYSEWQVGEDSQMYRLHSKFSQLNISNLHNSIIETITPWHAEWDQISAMFDDALTG